jgi:hypothetical protein
MDETYLQCPRSVLAGRSIAANLRLREEPEDEEDDDEDDEHDDEDDDADNNDGDEGYSE